MSSSTSTTAAVIKTFNTLQFNKGSFYVGEVVDGIREGRGQTKKKNGDIYTGDYKNNQRHGNGVYNYANGDKYEGQFVKNKKHGFGIYTYSTDKGTYYSGYWIENIKHGYGTLVYYDNVIIQGIFENGTITFGEILFPNETKYVGAINSYAMHGRGTMTYSDGFKVTGEFVEDYLRVDDENVCPYCMEKCDEECYESMEGICGSPEVFDSQYDTLAMPLDWKCKNDHAKPLVEVGSKVRTKVIKNDLTWNQSYKGVVRKVNDKWIYVKFDDGDYLMVDRDLLEMDV
jgi:hypothetical protein